MRQILFYSGTVFLILLLSACENESINFPEMLTLSQWDELNIENYEYEQRFVCFCAPPAGRFHKITVGSGEIVEIVDLEDGSAVVDEHNSFKTISKLLEFVESIDPDSVALINVEYDSSFGFPSFIYVDFSHGIADEEIGYETRNFKPN